MTDSHVTRRSLLRYGAYGAGAAALAGTAASWDRLTGADIPGRDDGSLVVATLGPAYGPEAIRTLTEGFRKVHPDIKLRINAVQAKPGRWNLELTFAHLRPGVAYTLWGNQTGATPVPGVVFGFFAIGTSLADAGGTATFDYQTTNPSNLGFDLNTTDPNYTVVTSWWSSQWLRILNSSGLLYVP